MRLRIRTESISDLALFLYLIIPILNATMSKALSVFGLGSYYHLIVNGFILMLYNLVCVKKRRIAVPDFWILYSIILVFFVITYLIHPEYEYWYTREDYGALNYVFRLHNGIFIYLFIRLVNDPKRIIKIIKVSAWPIYLWYCFQVVQAIHRGYWIDTSNRGYERHISYNLSLGYNLLIFVLPFIYSALEKKKPIDIIGAITGISIILVAGSRGPFVDIGIFFFIYILIKIKNSKRKAILLTSVIVVMGFVWICYPFFISALAVVLKRLNLSSRLVTKILSGEILDNSNRTVIWAAAIDMIEKNPFGYGAMGTRHVIYKYIYVAHPHQVFLEILVDFGVVFGTLMIIWIAYQTVRLFRMKGQDEWKAVFLLFFARACQLLLSLTFWHSIGLWGALAVGVCMTKAYKRGVRHGE